MKKTKKNKKNDDKERNIFIVVGILLIIIICTVVLLINKEEDESYIYDYKPNKDFIPVEINDDISLENYDSYVLIDYTEYERLFKGEKLKEEDFDNNNYAVIKIQYDACAEREITPVKYDINGNNIDVVIAYDSSCGVCALDYMYYLLKIDKSLVNVNVNTELIVRSREICDPNIAYKPIIYLYPTEKTNVNIKLGNPELLSVSYPKYNNEWNVVATPDGNLYDLKTNRNYYGLYWEGNNYNSKMTDEGFIVSGKDTVEFLEEKLSILGLNEREINEFIIYWLPKLEKNNYNYIRFETNNEIEKYMPLEINPTPDTIIRVYMLYKPLNERVNINEQKLEFNSRNGFTVVEWGGSNIN